MLQSCGYDGDMKPLILLMLSPLAAMAQDLPQDLPPGVESLQMLGGWPTGDGHRMVALELRLEPGWKTYWRSPGDAGIPPSFDWSGSENAAEVTIHWPRPEVIDSGGELTLGYRDELILPIEIAPADPDKPIRISGRVDFGLCRDLCVPAHADFTAGPPAKRRDPRILAALDAMPQKAAVQPACRIEEIRDGMRVTATLPEAHPEVGIGDEVGAGGQPAAALELAEDDSIWASPAVITRGVDRLSVSADFVAASGQPFALDPRDLRLTLIGGGGAIEYRGCASG